jgi:hypothetical protein
MLGRQDAQEIEGVRPLVEVRKLDQAAATSVAEIQQYSVTPTRRGKAALAHLRFLLPSRSWLSSRTAARS